MRVMKIAFASTLLVLAATAQPALAQDEFDEVSAPEEQDEDAPAEDPVDTAEDMDDADDAAEDMDDADAEAAEAQPAAQVEADPGDRFPIRRGFFVEADLGAFFAFGGINTNRQGLPSKTVSNLQPYVGTYIGYDVFHTPDMDLSLGFKGALILVGGSGRVSDQDIQTQAQTGNPRTQVSDYEIWEVGVGAAFDYVLAEAVSDRFALAFKVDGGLAIINTTPFEPSGLPSDNDGSSGSNFTDAGTAAFGGIVSASAGVNYATLLTGFSIGLDIRFSAIIGDDFIPGLSFTVPLKYNF